MWYGADPQSAQEKDGDFRIYLLHEFGHWVVAQEQDGVISVVGLGLYGLTHDESGRIRVVGAGGGVRFNYGSLAGPTELLAVAAAGIVAERLGQDEAFTFDDPVALFETSETFDGDFAKAREHLRALGMTAENSPRFADALRTAMTTAADIIRPLLPRMRAQVLRLERIVIEQRLRKLEIAWSGKHASLLTGRPDHDYEIDYSLQKGIL